MDEEGISMFAGITGASPEVARGFLEMAGGDVERAITLFFENPDLASGVGAGISGSSSTPAPAPAPGGRRGNAGREDSSGVIHIPSDDEDHDMDYEDVESDDDNDGGHAAAMQAANTAQEAEDAAMAKRLQEEMYQGPGGGGGSGGGGSGGGGSGGGTDGEDVRAPIARTTETLVAPDPTWGPSEGVDSAILEQLRRRRQPPRRGGGPFGHRIWGDGTSPVSESAANGSHARRLEDLFRPPYDLMARMDWDEARTLGKEDKKWILVNLQDMSDFNCQALNRDIWKDTAIKELISENFIFLQYDKDYPDAEEYVTFYFPNQGHENPDNYPHVSIIDPRTGEQVKVWSGRPFPSAVDFHAELAEFLDRYSLAANSKNPVARADAPKPKTVDVDRMTEEEMLEMALKNSLAGGGASTDSSSTPNVHDPDAFTKSSAVEGSDKGKEPEAAASPFAQIPSTNPHTEPENDPATTTRIQFRHSNGRIIRRFAVADPVRGIFEWLKAEPFEGKEGVEFELKKMPQGQDLIESLDTTVGDAGLKQGTVMIEFIEE